MRCDVYYIETSILLLKIKIIIPALKGIITKYVLKVDK